jgi:hypothetical protein
VVGHPHGNRRTETSAFGLAMCRWLPALLSTIRASRPRRAGSRPQPLPRRHPFEPRDRLVGRPWCYHHVEAVGAAV